MRVPVGGSDSVYHDWLGQVDVRIDLVLPGRTARTLAPGLWTYWHGIGLLPPEAVHRFAVLYFDPRFSDAYRELYDEKGERL